jgi:pSer/pThr/pTyr-binding forkhead associated (FHA) protein
VSSSPASHVLFQGRAYALQREPLVVGRAPGSASGISVPEGLAGISRRHCSFLYDGKDILLVDHSRFGTYVNGERIAERLRVRAGDRVRIGEPGVELSLIALSETGGAHAQAAP